MKPLIGITCRAETGDLPAVEQLLRRTIRHMAGQGIDQWDAIYPDRGTHLKSVGAQSL